MDISTTIISLTSVISKVAFKTWFKGNIVAEELSSELVDLVKNHIPDHGNSKKVFRLFDSVADEAAEKLQKLSSKFEDELSETARFKIEYAVENSLRRVKLNNEKIVKENLDPAQLELLISKSGLFAYSEMNDLEKNYYKQLLSASCIIIVGVTKQIPSLSILVQKELLIRTDAIQDKLEAVYDEIIFRSTSQSNEAKDFETRYLRSFSEKVGKYELVGLDVERGLKKIDLSVSYISLSASDVFGDMEDVSNIDSILSSGRRFIIQGNPGSGKTTLLQYVGLSYVKGTFENSSPSNLNKIPFMLPLRKYSDQSLPSISQLPLFAASTYIEMMPTEWATKIFTNGQAVLLIDGLDELKPKRREEVSEWLTELVYQFPNNTYILTSRPNALDENWYHFQDFRVVELLPMDPENIRKFVKHWHRAVAGYSPTKKVLNDLSRHERLLNSHIEENIRVRNMASSPLLCAMLCALNIDRNSIIPRERGELYRVVLDVLVERRDAQRGIESATDIRLLKKQKFILLQNIAYWMLINGQLTISRERIISILNEQLVSFPQNKSSAHEVCEYLVERSTILRETAEDEIEFIHKTFQEYFAAKKLIAEDSIPALVNHILNDDWKEVILLSAVHTKEKQSNKLIAGLLRKAEEFNNSQHKYIAQSIAIAARESMTELDSHLSKRLDSELEKILPIRNSGNIESIASLGDHVIPFLQCKSNLTLEEKIYHIRALRLIGNSYSLNCLSGYVGAEPKVNSELINSWVYFEAKEFGEKIISQFDSIDNFIWPFEYSLAGISFIRSVDKLVLRDIDLLDLLEFDLLKKVNVNKLLLLNCRGLTSLKFLEDLTGLSYLEVDECISLRKVSDINLPESLVKLKITKCRNLNEIEILNKSTKLTKLVISDCQELTSIRFVEMMPSLKEIDVDGCISLKSLTRLEFCKRINHIKCDRIELIDTLPDELARFVE